MDKIDILNIKKELVNNIDKEMNRLGFICDSDCCDRFIDNELKNLIEEYSLDYDEYEDNINDYFDDISAYIRGYITAKYNAVIEQDKYGNLTEYFYDTKYNFNTVEELENYFKIGE